MKLTVTHLLQRSGLFPRRQLRRGVSATTVDGTQLKPTAVIELGTEPIRLEMAGQWYQCSASPSPVLILNKPGGVVCSTRADGGHTPVLHLVPEAYAALPWLTVGRLDAETTGLVILTCDGQLVQRLSHPKRAIPRDYLVATDDPLGATEMAQLLAGEVVLHDGLVPMPTMMEAVESVQETVADGLEDVAWTRVRLIEGKYHEVRRMFAAVGHHVVALHRERFGPISLVGEDVDNRGVAEESNEASEQAHALFRLFVSSGEVLRLSDEQVLALYDGLGMLPPDEVMMVVPEE